MMERMINSRLTWYLETNGLITNMQTGFRKRRGTLDHLIRLETFIRKQHLMAVFFDLEKAYNTTWKYGIMWDLYDLGLRGRLPMFIKNFLFERTFWVRMGSNSQHQEEGVPQGSILSVIFFSIKINNIVKYCKMSNPLNQLCCLRQRLRHMLSGHSYEHSRATTPTKLKQSK